MLTPPSLHGVVCCSRLESNFDKDLLRLFNEVRYWDKFGGEFDIPYQALLMYREQDGLRVLRESVMLVVRDYNAIVDALPGAQERRLFQEHLARLDHIIKPGLYKISWSEKTAIRVCTLHSFTAAHACPRPRRCCVVAGCDVM